MSFLELVDVARPELRVCWAECEAERRLHDPRGARGRQIQPGDTLQPRIQVNGLQIKFAKSICSVLLGNTYAWHRWMPF